MGATVIQEQDVQAVGKGPRQVLNEELVMLRIEIRQLQEKPLVRGQGDGTRNVESFERVLDQPHGVDLTGRQSSAAHGQSADAAFILAAYAPGAGMLRRNHPLMPRLAGPLNLGNGR
jgi:hypothetical protein